jgi:hypothetical protein
MKKKEARIWRKIKKKNYIKCITDNADYQDYQKCKSHTNLKESEVKIKFKKHDFEGEGRGRKREGEERVKER